MWLGREGSEEGEFFMQLRPEKVCRIEDAPSGLAYIMRKHGAVFYSEQVSHYLIHIPSQKGGRRRLRSRDYEFLKISKRDVELISAQIDRGAPPMEIDAQPVRRRAGYGAKNKGKRL